MKILVTGGTGFVGTKLVGRLLELGHSVHVLSRGPEKYQNKWKGDVTLFKWSAPHGELPKEAFEKIDSVIHLMGENIGDKRWSAQQKIKLRESRVDATRNLAKALSEHAPELKSFISTSAIGIYPVNTKTKMTEQTPADQSFLASLCIDWEKEVEKIKTAKRKVILRVGVVLAKGGGALAKLMPIFKLGAGGPVGSGQQMMSWIHRDDLVEIYIKALEDENYTGAINAVAPNPVSNKAFSQSLAKALSRPCLFPVPPFMLKLAMGEMSTIVLDGQDVTSEKLSELNFEFCYPTIDGAFTQIVKS